MAFSFFLAILWSTWKVAIEQLDFLSLMLLLLAPFYSWLEIVLCCFRKAGNFGMFSSNTSIIHQSRNAFSNHLDQFLSCNLDALWIVVELSALLISHISL